MERQEAIQGVRIVLTSYTASFRVPFSMSSSQNSPGDEEAGEEDEGQEGGEPPFVLNGPPSEPPFCHPKNRSTRL
jgi:hypothetical protein